MNGEAVIVDDVAVAFATTVREAYDKRPNPSFSLALSGGSTAASCYEHLAKEPLDWSVITLLWGDERCVPLSHADSNYALAKQALLDSIPTPAAVHPMRCEDGAEAYESVVRSVSPLDLIHLGMGDDGHTASLFPGSPALDAPPERLVVATGDNLHPHPRMTFTYSTIARARLAVFTVSGIAKRQMLGRIRQGEHLPAGRVAAERVIWLVDRAAAA